jgi:hypothetical protein
VGLTDADDANGRPGNGEYDALLLFKLNPVRHPTFRLRP